MSGDRSSDPSKPGRAQFGALDGAVMTVTGPVPVRDLGLFDAHDHLLIDSPALPGQSLVDVDRAIEEVEEARSLGVTCIVEMTPIGLGRDPAGMRAIAAATGVAIVATSGFHVDVHYPPDHWARTETVEVLAERKKAQAMLDQARADIGRECASGEGTRCKGRRATEAVYAAAVTGHDAKLAALPPMQTANGQYKALAQGVVRLPWFRDRKVADVEQDLIILLPWLAVLLAELSVPAFLSLAHSPDDVATTIETARAAF